MKYQINLVSEIRQDEKRKQLHDSLQVYAFVALAGIITIVLLKSTLFLQLVRQDLNLANAYLKTLETEYQRYQQTTMTVEKQDLELLDQLQHGRLFWTKKLSSMALPLPPNYWVNRFEYKSNQFSVDGFGYIDGNQRQLITLDDYLNILRADTTFRKGLEQIFLVETRRTDLHSEDGDRDQVSFQFRAKPMVLPSTPRRKK